MEENMTENKVRNTSGGENKLSMPAAIIVAGVVIAGAIFFSSKSPETPLEGTDLIAAVTDQDHIKGSLDADVIIVEYSDFECPFCKNFHNTMNQIMDEYESSGKVAWVYRQFPLKGLHSKAPLEAQASECVAELGGNDAFWQFADGFFAVTPSNDRTELETVLPQLTREIGIDDAAFSECLTSGRHQDKVEADIQNAVDSGGRGTPWSVVIGPDGSTYPLSGAQPYERVKQAIEFALENN